MKKGTGIRKCLKRIMMALSAVIMTTAMPITAMADSESAGDIVIKNVLAGYEYKVYEVLDVAILGVGSEGLVLNATEDWKDFIKTDENAVALLNPAQADILDMPMLDADKEYYTLNTDADSKTKRAFAEAVLDYAKENGIEPTESKVAENGDKKVSFTYLTLGMYVIDTAGKARVTVMMDLEWVSEIKESYKPETETADTSTKTEEKAKIQQDTTNSTEENSADKNVAADKEDPKADSNAPVIIVIVAAVLAVAAVLLFVKRKK